MYVVISPDTSFNGEFAGFKFKNGNCITKLDENLRLWFKMLKFVKTFVQIYYIKNSI